MPGAETSAGPALETSAKLSFLENLFLSLIATKPLLTPVSCLELFQAKYPDYVSMKLVQEDDLSNQIRPVLLRLRDKLAPDSFTVYSINHFQTYFLGPIKPVGKFLTLTQLPPVFPEQTLPQEPRSLFQPFYQVAIFSPGETKFLATPNEFKLLLALANHGLNRPLSHEKIYPQVFADDLRWAEDLRPIVCRLRKILPAGWNIVAPEKLPGHYQLVKTSS